MNAGKLVEAHLDLVACNSGCSQTGALSFFVSLHSFAFSISFFSCSISP